MLSRARRIVAFSGAGLSAASGLATFRGSRTDALWSRFDPMALATPQAFARDPGLVLAWYGWRRGQLRRAEPNAAHRAVAARGDIVQVTQNVDDLLERAGARQVIHLHGEILDDCCHAGCGFRRSAAVTTEAAFDPDDRASHPAVESCPDCGGPLRPAVTWFGEALPASAWARAEAACRVCDVMLVVGSSGTVYPAAGLVDLAKRAGAAVIVVDPGESAFSAGADVVIAEPAEGAVPRLLAAEDADRRPVDVR